MSSPLTLPHTVTLETTPRLLVALLGQIIQVEIAGGDDLRGRCLGCTGSREPGDGVKILMRDYESSQARLRSIPLGSVIHAETGPLADL